MYVSTIGALPRFLTPPQAVRDLLRGVVGAIVQGTTVTVPTPIGPQVFNLGDPADVARLKSMISKTKFSVATPRPGGAPSLVDQVPGGMATIGVVGLVAAIALGAMLGRRGRK